MPQQVLRTALAGTATSNTAAEVFEPVDEGLAGGLIGKPVDGVPGDGGGFVATGGILGEEDLFVTGQSGVIVPPIHGKQFVRGQQIDEGHVLDADEWLDRVIEER